MNRAALAFSLLLATTACATPTPPERASSAYARAEDYGTTLTALADEIDFTTETLRALQANAVDARGSNRETFETFERGVKNLAVLLERARKDYARMDTRAHAFLATFGTDEVASRDASFQRAQEERRVAIQTRFEELAREDVALQQRLERYRQGLAELAAQLSADLSPRTFAAGQPALERAGQGGSALRAELALLAAKVEAARAALEPLRAPQASEAPGVDRSN
jgi:hypothetical protein